MTDCVLHIGLEKTGTTSIQATLAANRDALIRQGILYPLALGERSHVKAYAYGSEGPSDEIKFRCGLEREDMIEAYRSSVRADLQAEIATTRPDTICISNEHLSSRFQTTREIENLANLIGNYCSSTRVIVYLRSQGDSHRSAYSTYVKTGGVEPFAFPSAQYVLERYRYDLTLARWEEIFGINHLDVRLYDPGDLADGDLISDFLTVFNGAVDPSSLARPELKNVSLDAFSLEFLKAINRYVPYKMNGRMNDERGNLHELVESFSHGSPFQGDSAITAALDAAVHESNESVRARYFPGRTQPLFDRPTERNEAASEITSIPDEAVRLMAHLWRAKQNQLLQLRRRLEGRNKPTAHEEGRPVTSPNRRSE